MSRVPARRTPALLRARRIGRLMVNGALRAAVEHHALRAADGSSLRRGGPGRGRPRGPARCGLRV
ncbi:hypothetical protein LUW77_02010 [Streptomyces radiopugnans]|nr:hypothetical protein LUW77_02010 [Streptomyces radiopugnans]